MFPDLFPYGRGGYKQGPNNDFAKLTTYAQVRLNFYDRRFAKHNLWSFSIGERKIK